MRSRVVPVLLAVVVAASAGLAALAVASIAVEVESARERCREQVEAAARNLASALEAEAAASNTIDGALAWFAAEGGELTEPAVERGGARALARRGEPR